MSEIFYPVTSAHPPLGVRVIVQWYGREIACARTRDRKSGEVRWVTHERGKLVTLPPNGQEKRWGEDPECWRPERPDLWDAGLPSPIERQAAPRMVYRTARNRYSAMAAQAAESDRRRAEILAEIEAEYGNGQEAIGNGDDGEPSCLLPNASCQWWLTEPLTYSDAGEISLREAEGRVARAILTDGIRSRYGGPRAQLAVGNALGSFVHETILSTDADVMQDRFEPTPRDVDDYLVAFAWFAALNPPELWHKRREPYALSQAQSILVWRMIVPPLSWRRIGKLTRLSHMGAKQVYGAALAGIHRAANGKPVLQHVSVADRMAALRERNRSFRTREEGGFVD